MSGQLHAPTALPPRNLHRNALDMRPSRLQSRCGGYGVKSKDRKLSQQLLSLRTHSRRSTDSFCEREWGVGVGVGGQLSAATNGNVFLSKQNGVISHCRRQFHQTLDSILNLFWWFEDKCGNKNRLRGNRTERASEVWPNAAFQLLQYLREV
jgi:hypothetical protein